MDWVDFDFDDWRSFGLDYRSQAMRGVKTPTPLHPLVSSWRTHYGVYNAEFNGPDIV